MFDCFASVAKREKLLGDGKKFWSRKIIEKEEKEMPIP